MKRTTKRMLIWWGVVVCCAGFLAWSVMSMADEFSSRWGGWLWHRIDPKYHHRMWEHRPPYAYDVYRTHAGWEARAFEHWRSDPQDYGSVAGFLVHCFPTRQGLWAPTVEYAMEFEYGPIAEDNGDDDALPSNSDFERMQNGIVLQIRDFPGIFNTLPPISSSADYGPVRNEDRIIWSGWAHNILALTSLVGLIWGSANGLLSIRRLFRERALARVGCCQSCGYSLSGLPSDAPCPECGGLVHNAEQR